MKEWISNIFFSIYETFLNRYLWKKHLRKVAHIGKNIDVENGFIITSGHEYVSIGDNVGLSDILINAGKGGEVIIGDNVFFGRGTMVIARGHDVRKKGLERKLSVVTAPIHIHDGAWVASGSILLPGITIGKNAVVGAGSVVTKDVAENTIVGGVPAKKIRNLSC